MLKVNDSTEHIYSYEYRFCAPKTSYWNRYMTKPVSWGLIGAINVAREWMIDAIRSQPGNEIVTVMSSDADRAAKYAKANDITGHSTSLDAVFSDPRVNAVYISTTNELHKAQTIAAAGAGKQYYARSRLPLISAMLGKWSPAAPKRTSSWLPTTICAMLAAKRNFLSSTKIFTGAHSLRLTAPFAAKDSPRQLAKTVYAR
jgi:hypothetical protein